MRKQEIMQEFNFHCISYCNFGVKVQKHTDLFSNMEFKPPPCDGNQPGHLTHQKVLGLHKDQRSVVPPLLAQTIVEQMIAERARRDLRKEERRLIRKADLRGEVAEKAEYMGERDPGL
jgi:hypothetical protein